IDPAPVRRKRPVSGSRRRRWPVAVAALLLALVGLAAVAVYRIQTDNGELVITTDNPDIEVVIKQDGKLVRIIDTRTNKEVKLDSGRYDLELKGQPDDLKLSLDKVTIRRGEAVVATVERRPGPPKGEERVGEIRRFEPGHGGIWKAVLSADGRYAAASSEEGVVSLWNARTGEKVGTFKCGDKMVWAVALAPDGATLAAGGEDEGVRLWDVETGKERRILGWKGQAVR